MCRTATLNRPRVVDAIAGDLTKLADLKSKGVITDAEGEIQRTKVLA
jgi:hypothetical protein